MRIVLNASKRVFCATFAKIANDWYVTRKVMYLSPIGVACALLAN